MERSYGRLASLAFTIVIVAALAADPHQGHSQAQRFLARADVVSVDVSVLDRNRRPVTDLTAADFTLLEDGKAQTIEHFERKDPPRRFTSRARSTSAPRRGRTCSRS